MPHFELLASWMLLTGGRNLPRWLACQRRGPALCGRIFARSYFNGTVSFPGNHAASVIARSPPQPPPSIRFSTARADPASPEFH